MTCGGADIYVRQQTSSTISRAHQRRPTFKYLREEKLNVFHHAEGTHRAGCISPGRAAPRAHAVSLIRWGREPSHGLPSMRSNPTNGCQAIGIADVLIRQPSISHTAVRQNQSNGVDIHERQQPPSIRIPIDPAPAQFQISTQPKSDEVSSIRAPTATISDAGASRSPPRRWPGWREPRTHACS